MGGVRVAPISFNDLFMNSHALPACLALFRKRIARRQRALLILLNSILYGRANDVSAAQQGRTRFFFFNLHSLKHFFVAHLIQGYAPVHPPASSQIFLLEKSHFFRDMGGEGECSRNLNDSPISLVFVRLRVICLSVVASAAERRRRRSDGGPKNIHNGLKYADAALPSPSGRSQEPDVTQQEAGPTTPVISTL